MSRFPCPVCGDPNGFPIWIDAKPPEGCPEDEAWHPSGGGKRSINSVTECPYQMRKAAQRAEWRRAAPECFDESGNMIPGELANVLVKWQDEFPDKELIL